MLNLPHPEFLGEVPGPDRILDAADDPDLTDTGTRRFLEQLPVSEERKERITGENAETLLRLPSRDACRRVVRRRSVPPVLTGHAIDNRE